MLLKQAKPLSFFSIRIKIRLNNCSYNHGSIFGVDTLISVAFGTKYVIPYKLAHIKNN
ncbi:hypothetical protein DFQ12_2171 [Sphingobacterium detergens]|uniref:Uncharacterized protein n=1 Tax=Sphingobacterium detergens TaxID=1145106 RepID=A0A420BKZ0_SPHD1|nr:hypothetical protein DFQ12_2171 [Sphingobacterium detergens]